MQLRKLFDDDEAVSPVIGVILMVAITVILAAVIATFVLGLGEQVSDTAPQASFNFNYEDGDTAKDSWGDSASSSKGGLLTITHSSGATLNANQLYVSGSGVHGERLDWGSDGSGTYPAAADSEVSSGDSADLAVQNGDNIKVTWQNKEGTDSATLSNYDVPN